MKRALFLLAACSMMGFTAKAQTQVTEYKPGLTPDGITYFLPSTQIKVVVRATKVHHIPGEFCEYAQRFLRLKDVPQSAYDTWNIDGVKLYTYGRADKQKAYSIKLKQKTSAPLVSMSNDGRLLSVNATKLTDEAELPLPSVTKVKEKKLNPNDFKTQEILSAGSVTKMAELTANEIYDIRENRSLLTKGQADFMPKDGEQLKLMLASLDNQEEGLLQLFKGTTETETHVFTFDIDAKGNLDKQPLFRFSRFLGMADADDQIGDTYYISVQDLKTLPEEVAATGKPKKVPEDIRYIVPGRAEVKVFNADGEVVSQSFPMAQFGRVEMLGGELFNKKNTTHVYFSPTTGGIVKLEGEKPE